MPTIRATRTAVAVCGSLALIGGIAVATPGMAVATAPVSSAHPYSDPVWYPLAVSTKVDCVRDNPGCTKPHDFWGMDVVPIGQSSAYRATVNAMGAGIAHIGNPKGDACPAATTSFGTWVWVDHGGGNISRYGHINSILISEGQLVATGTPLGTLGVTGKGGNCSILYTDFMLRHKGIRGPSYEFKTLNGCGYVYPPVGPERWPTLQGYARWNDVPRGTRFRGNHGHCQPTTVPATPNRPGSVTLARAGDGRLKATWTKPPASARVDKIRVEFGRYRPGKGIWDYQHNERWYDLSPTTTAKTIAALEKDHKWRVRVHFHNAAGWSVGSSWKTRTVR